MRAMMVALSLGAMPAAAQEPAWSCRFTVECEAGLCDAVDRRLQITALDHEPGLVFDYLDRVIPARPVPVGAAPRHSYAADDGAGLHLVTVFPDGQALGSVHRLDERTGTVTGAIRFGNCLPL